MQAHDVAGGKQFVECNSLGPERGGGLGGDERVVGEQPALERLEPRGDLAADPAEADDADRPAAERAHAVERDAELPGPSRTTWLLGTTWRVQARISASVWSATSSRQKSGTLQTGMPPRGGRGKVDVVDADAVTDDQPRRVEARWMHRALTGANWVST